MLCLSCNAETVNAKFCSRSCSNSYNNKVNPKRKRKIYYCKECNVQVKSRRSLCDECYCPDKKLEEVLYDKHHRSSTYALVRTRARALMKNEPQICYNCGYSKHVEVGHIIPIKSFPLSTLLSVINKKDNLVLLCPNCHWELDNGFINFKDYTATSALIAGCA